ncbi:MAG: hypothetical protein LAT51_12935 [Flavobacteriaceae bacterium]|nr:hypothetical protein [Flavobacteriaceae bacterium]
MTKRKKITYLLGAGASYNSVPIWKEQGLTMQEMGFRLKTDFKGFKNLVSIFKSMEVYGKYALEYGTIDIYARRLFLNEKHEELNKLKLALSLYLDIWENFQEIRDKIKTSLIESKEIPSERNYDAIDKRYYSLLSVILNKNKENSITIDDNVNFITWNYDLQLESAFESFLMEKEKSLRDLNQKIKFLNDSELSKNKIIHLNGVRGCFESSGKFEDIIERKFIDRNLNDYLSKLDAIYKMRNSKSNMQNSINYAWENQDKRIKSAIEIMKETDILVIIGYSFPSFNKLVDAKLINAFNQNGERLFYQDFNSSLEKLNFTKLHKSKFIQSKVCDQFHVPNEFFPELRTGENSNDIFFC